jgi:hypothetical protein
VYAGFPDAAAAVRAGLLKNDQDWQYFEALAKIAQGNEGLQREIQEIAKNYPPFLPVSGGEKPPRLDVLRAVMEALALWAHQQAEEIEEMAEPQASIWVGSHYHASMRDLASKLTRMVYVANWLAQEAPAVSPPDVLANGFRFLIDTPAAIPDDGFLGVLDYQVRAIMRDARVKNVRTGAIPFAARQTENLRFASISKRLLTEPENEEEAATGAEASPAKKRKPRKPSYFSLAGSSFADAVGMILRSFMAFKVLSVQASNLGDWVAQCDSWWENRSTFQTAKDFQDAFGDNPFQDAFGGDLGNLALPPTDKPKASVVPLPFHLSKSDSPIGTFAGVDKVTLAVRAGQNIRFTLSNKVLSKTADLLDEVEYAFAPPENLIDRQDRQEDAIRASLLQQISDYTSNDPGKGSLPNNLAAYEAASHARVALTPFYRLFAAYD